VSSPDIEIGLIDNVVAVAIGGEADARLGERVSP
jgi:hypothetical protein